jgi:adenylate cyclase
MAQGELHTFVFADISGYSLVTALAGDEAAADMALHFMSRATTLAAEHDGEVVKGLGDAVMLHADSPIDSIRLALALMDEFGRDHLPAIHAGVHTGPALRRSGDWWGTTVNVAAHVADVAEAGQLLVTKAARAAAGNMSSISFRGLGSRRLKNIPFPVQVYAATRAAPRPPCDGLAARVPRTGRLAARVECDLEARSC